MVRNNIEMDVKIKCLEIGTTGQYVSRVIKKNSLVNKTFVDMMEALGYDIELTYVKRER